jgi:hypothetical protein
MDDKKVEHFLKGLNILATASPDPIPHPDLQRLGYCSHRSGWDTQGLCRGRREEEDHARILRRWLFRQCSKSTTWCTHHPRDSCTNVRNSSGAITHSTCRSSSNSHNSSTFMALLHHSSRPLSGHHCSLHLSGSHASTTGKPAILSETAARSSRAIHHELQHP